MDGPITFGQWLKLYRRAQDLTREELADRLGCSFETLRKIESNQRRPSRQLAEIMANVLDIPDEQHQLMVQFARSVGAVRVPPQLPLDNLVELQPLSQPAVVGPALNLLAKQPTVFRRGEYHDCGEAPNSSSFFGRQDELQTLAQWINEEGCRLVGVLGIGGLGKTALVAKLTRTLLPQFDYVLWRSLHNAPPCNEVLADWLHCLGGSQEPGLPQQYDQQITRLVDYLRQQRCLLVLDNLETLFYEQQYTGVYRAGFEGYSELIRRIAETGHQSCLIVTSREKPKELSLLEGPHAPVHSLQLSGLPLKEAQSLLLQKNLTGTAEQWATLVTHYGGNPLALKIVSELIRIVFNGDIDTYLKTGQLVFGDIFNLLHAQFHRLSALEQQLMFWLAVEREPCSLERLRASFAQPQPAIQLAEAIASLCQRSLVEKQGSGFTLQHVVMEFVTHHLTQHAAEEILSGSLDLLMHLALLKVDSNEYVRESQHRLILGPIAEQLSSARGHQQLAQIFDQLFVQLRQSQCNLPAYAAGNLINLMIQLGLSLTGYDLSQLVIWQADLRRTTLHDVNLAGADLSRSVFTDTFGQVLCVSFSHDGAYFAAGMTDGELRMWRASDCRHEWSFEGHRDWVRSVAFSPDGRLLASASDDETVRLWDLQNGQCIHTVSGHIGRVLAIAFTPDSATLITGGEDKTLRFWNVHSADCLRVLQAHDGWIWSVACSQDGSLIASGGGDRSIHLWHQETGDYYCSIEGYPGDIRSIAISPDSRLIAAAGDHEAIHLWDIRSGTCRRVLSAHQEGVFSLAFRADGRILASASPDHTIRLWDVASGQCQQVLSGHTKWVRSLAFSPDGEMLVSGSKDRTIRLWNVSTRRCQAILHGYSVWTGSLAFSPDSRTLASSSDDQMIRLWDVETGRCWHTLREEHESDGAVAFSPDGRSLSISSSQTVEICDLHSGQRIHCQPGHTELVRSLAFSPDGRLLASCSEDRTIKLYNPATGHCLRTLTGHNGWIWCAAFSPDQQLLASSSDDQTIRLWEVETGICRAVLSGHSNSIWSVAFSPDGALLASGCDDFTVRLWRTATGECVRVLSGHQAQVWSVAFNPTTGALATGSADGTIRFWDPQSGRCTRILQQEGRVRRAVFSPDGALLASSGSDAMIRIWETQSGRCVRILRVPKPYDGLSLVGVTGLSAMQKAKLRALGAITEAIPYQRQYRLGQG